MAIETKNLKVGTYYHVRLAPDTRVVPDLEVQANPIQVARYNGGDNWHFGHQTKDGWWAVESVEAEVER